jgi:hypothetical protein
MGKQGIYCALILLILIFGIVMVLEYGPSITTGAVIEQTEEPLAANVESNNTLKQEGDAGLNTITGSCGCKG